MNINQATTELVKIFNIFNQELFDGELEEPIITIQSSCKKFVNGWFTPAQTWTNESRSIAKNEIAIIAERLCRPHKEIADTMLHEMVHYYGYIKGIKNTNGAIHNKKFRDMALEHGLDVYKNKKLGWAFTVFNEEGERVYNTIVPDLDAFSMYRISEEKEKREKTTSYKYVCPECNKKFTIKHNVEVICKDCNVEFDMEEKNPEDEQPE